MLHRATHLHWRAALWSAVLFGTIGLVVATALGRGEVAIEQWVTQTVLWTLLALFNIEGFFRRRIAPSPPAPRKTSSRKPLLIAIGVYALVGVAAIVEAVLWLLREPAFAGLLTLDAAVIGAVSVLLICHKTRRRGGALFENAEE